MDFDNNSKPIYLQIVDLFCERVAAGELGGEERIPSVREYGASIGVNPNTVARSYEKLTDLGILYNRRGIGYFVASDAKQKVLEEHRKTFLEVELPEFIRRATLLGLDPKELVK